MDVWDDLIILGSRNTFSVLDVKKSFSVLEQGCSAGFFQNFRRDTSAWKQFPAESWLIPRA